MEERERMDPLKSGESSERNDIMDPILVGVLFNKRKTNLGRTATGARQLLQMGSQMKPNTNHFHQW
jgi:hypothetical protein